MIKKSQLSRFQARLTLRQVRRLFEGRGSVADLTALRRVEGAVASLVPRSAPPRKRQIPRVLNLTTEQWEKRRAKQRRKVTQ